MWLLSQWGDDRLENTFSSIQCATHQKNVDTLELAQKAASAMDTQEILGRHSDWDRGHQHLKFVNDLADDHVNPKSWTGDVESGKVDGYKSRL